MHERSLALALLEQVEAHAAAQGAMRVEEVCVQVGPLAGVEPLLLHSAFEQVADGSIAGSARLVIAEVSLVARCLDCETEFVVERFRFACPICSSSKTQLLQGDAVVLESIRIEDNAATAVTDVTGSL
jgi:hydrogenase nickel incorporation protein HypA/HybF